ncbi:C40 family peptidase [Streptacidiphilus griseoplanus]|uniref:C40 family peptidase n=1 Tax=Peterkaempfera griseoplana TaxID=66896 RepID=UPI0006E29577|nr:peptidoglycan-binding protein [Peterkaempfera griseoplana]
MRAHGRLSRIGRGTAAGIAAGLLALTATTSASAATVPPRINLLSSDCPSTVKQGQLSGCVTELQTLLDAGGAALDIDGDFGPATNAAVLAYQSSKGLTADGLVGPATKAALYRKDPAVPIDLRSLNCPVQLEANENDGCVTELQNRLRAAGASLTVTHVLDTATAAAVTTYLSSHHLSVTGLVDPPTKAALYGDPAPQQPADLGPGRYAAVVGFAQQALGQNIQYVWGGGHEDGAFSFGPSIGICDDYTGAISPCPADTWVGLDCSGFTRWLYWRAGAGDIGQTTRNQVANPRFGKVTAATAVPGDLVFFGGSAATVHHVGVYIGNGLMINAPYTGTYVRQDTVASHTDLLGYYHLGS